MRMMECPTSGLILPNEFVDEKQSLKRLIDSWLDKTVEQFQHLKNTYFLTFHAKFDEINKTIFKVDPPKITSKIPPFLSNSLVFWVNNQKGICELL